MTTVMKDHLKQGLSIGYYSGVDNDLLGGFDFPFPSSGGIVRVCVSGKAGDGSFQTYCENIHKDNDINGVAGDPFCVIAVGQDLVSDGCYVPASGVVVVDGQSATLTSLSSSTTHLSASIPLHPPTSLTTLVGATITTITSNGATQTVVVAPQVAANSAGSGYTKDVVVPIILSLFALLFAALGVFIWWYKKRARDRAARIIPPATLGAYVPPPRWHQQEDGRSTLVNFD